MTKLLDESEAKIFRFSPDVHRGIPWRLSFPTHMTEGPFPGGRKPKKVFPAGKQTWHPLGLGTKDGHGSGNIYRGIAADVISGLSASPPTRAGIISGIPDGVECDRPAEGLSAAPAALAFEASQGELGVVFSAWPTGAGPHRDALQMLRLLSLVVGSMANTSTAQIRARSLPLDGLCKEPWNQVDDAPSTSTGGGVGGDG